MLEKRKDGGFTPQENNISALPSAIAGVFVLFSLMNTSLLQFHLQSIWAKLFVILFGILGTVYLAIFHVFLIPRGKFIALYCWANAVLGGLALGLLSSILPDEADIFLSILLILGTISTAIMTDRWPPYLLIVISNILIFFFRWELLVDLREWAQHASFIVLAIIAVETIQQLKNLSSHQVARLEIVNNFSHQITSTLNVEQVTALLDAALQNALTADTYYVGLCEGDEIKLKICFDDGEYFENVSAKVEGTLSGWVIKNQRELFLPDLRNDVELPGVNTVIIGKQRTSLSWMGVPMKSSLVNGIVAIASYRPNAFDRSDIELLSNLTQHAVLALDNAFRHSQVEEESHLDGLTRVFNHGYFLRILEKMAEDSNKSNVSLSLIMLDIDYFKQYNDTYGHLAGDDVLTRLCDTIRDYVKRTDAVGRWGGEEFVIALPNTNSEQAQMVANRIRETMASLILTNKDQKTMPAPTISQGIAQYPDEANDIIRLIDLADHRLYIAKERGRNEIEPATVTFKS